MKDGNCGCKTEACSCSMSDSPPSEAKKKAMVEALRKKGIEAIPPDSNDAFTNRPDINMRRLNPSPWRKA